MPKKPAKTKKKRELAFVRPEKNVEKNRLRFLATYTKELQASVNAAPEKYPWYEKRIKTVEEVAEKMVDACAEGAFEMTDTLKNTALRLDVKPNRKAIWDFLSE